MDSKRTMINECAMLMVGNLKCKSAVTYSCIYNHNRSTYLGTQYDESSGFKVVEG